MKWSNSGGMFEKRGGIGLDNRHCLSLGALGAERCGYVYSHTCLALSFSPFLLPGRFFLYMLLS